MPYEHLRQQLLSRRHKLELIVDHLEIQKLSLHDRACLDDCWQGPSRADLLQSLDDWYHKEILEMDRALARVDDNAYGRCLGCAMSIDAEWLEHLPAAEYCRSCADLRKWLSIG